MLKIDSLQELLDKEVNRKEFLQLMGAGILGVIGITSFLNNLLKFTKSQTGKNSQNKVQSGYGGSAYGR